VVEVLVSLWSAGGLGNAHADTDRSCAKRNCGIHGLEEASLNEEKFALLTGYGGHLQVESDL